MNGKKPKDTHRKGWTINGAIKRAVENRLGRRDQKVTPIEKAKTYFDSEKQAI